MARPHLILAKPASGAAVEPERFGVRDLRNDTAGVLAAAERSGEVLITRNGEVVAKLTPFREQPDERTPTRRFLDLVANRHVDTGWADDYEQAKAEEIAAQVDDAWE